MVNKKQLKNIQLKFLFILLISNISIFLLLSPSSKTKKKTENLSIERKDYIKIKIRGFLHTSLNTKSPVQMITTDSKNHIKNIFVLERIETSSQAYQLETNKIDTFMILIHKSNAYPLMSNQLFNIYPKNMNLKKKLGRREYEVIF